MLGLGVNDATSGFRAYRAATLADIDLHDVRTDGYGFQVELTFKAVRNGAKVWEMPLGPFPNEWGSASSPVLYGSMLLLNCDTDGEDFLLAVDKTTGKTIWRTSRTPPDGISCTRRPHGSRGGEPNSATPWRTSG